MPSVGSLPWAVFYKQSCSNCGHATRVQDRRRRWQERRGEPAGCSGPARGGAAPQWSDHSHGSAHRRRLARAARRDGGIGAAFRALRPRGHRGRGRHAHLVRAPHGRTRRAPGGHQPRPPGFPHRRSRRRIGSRDGCDPARGVDPGAAHAAQRLGAPRRRDAVLRARDERRGGEPRRHGQHDRDRGDGGRGIHLHLARRWAHRFHSHGLDRLCAVGRRADPAPVAVGHRPGSDLAAHAFQSAGGHSNTSRVEITLVRGVDARANFDVQAYWSSSRAMSSRYSRPRGRPRSCTRKATGTSRCCARSCAGPSGPPEGLRCCGRFPSGTT